MTESNGPRTLVVHVGGIGDFILTFPALRVLGSEGPIDLLGRRDRLELAVAAGLAERAYDIEDVDFSALFTKVSPKLDEFLEPYSRIVCWMWLDDAMKGRLSGNGAREVNVFSGLPTETWDRHASLYYLDCLGSEAPQNSPLHFAPVQSSHDVVIHPGSGSRKKNWPIERFGAVAQSLAEQGRRVEWVRGPAEDGMTLPDAASILEFDSLVTLAQELAGARLYIGNDSGVTHLAAVAGCPTVAIFGRTDPAVWAPRGAHVRVVRADPWPTVGEVLETARSLAYKE